MSNPLFTLSTDSTADLLPGFAEKNGIALVPLTFNVEKNGEFTQYKDQFNSEEEYVNFYQSLRDGAFSRTAMLNLQDHLDHFRSMAEKGAKDVLHFTISYGLSPTVDVANQAAAMIKEEYPDFNVYAMESCSATVGQGALVKLALQMRNEGKTAKQAYDILSETKYRLQHFIIADDLFYLKRGGRVSGAKAVMGTILNVKPFITIDGNGKLKVEGSFRGMKKAFSHILEEIDRLGVGEENTVVVVHTDAKEKAEELAQRIYDKTGIMPEVQIMGPVIGSHVGPGAVACGMISKTARVPDTVEE